VSNALRESPKAEKATANMQVYTKTNDKYNVSKKRNTMKKALRETQTLRARWL